MVMSMKDKRNSLTKRQQEIYNYVKDRIQNRGYAPTVREIGEHFGIKSPNGVMCHLKALEKKGIITRESNMSRAICLAETKSQKLALPLVGTAVSGSPYRAAVSSDEQVEFEQLFSGGDKACLTVKGTAFCSLGISDGDHIIICRDGNSETGDLIAALDERHCVTICRVQDNGQQPVPVIEGAAPTPTRQVLGTIVGIVRRFGGDLSTSA